MKMKTVTEQAAHRPSRSFEVPDMPYSDIPWEYLYERYRNSLPVRAPRFKVGDLVRCDGAPQKVFAVLWDDSLGSWHIYTPGLIRPDFDVVAL